ncbi:transcriptional regulator, Crp/Fnr family [Desulfurobacterium thermolithotrophum DSM 11699]|uniref:Transcriptional regulator, Crp/Fnr family n=1 Tax=Desulfurobacterium thermolithotrophum (strain DSM 11699 / BSA) TaxID=868864 RepID=F0S3Q4_DESTD|nr:Crp/Fnr family transcriptional regulator [Desulfurobacterium thermolithotrophum]ADY73476.1 transcriptional regulator, Crp/Fnr family [Desulfurobacterium thermolithotrophum DSM 11699]
MIEVLKKVQLLSGLSEKQLRKLEEISILKQYTKGKIIFNPSQKAEGFYILLKGKIKIYKTKKGKEQILRIFSSPVFFGEAASFTGENFPVWAETLEDSKILFISRKQFLELMREDPEIAIKLLTIMSKRLIYLTNLIESLSLKDALSKVSFYILKKVEETNNNEIEFRTNIVAMQLGLTKETVSRVLSKLKLMEVIKKDGNKVKILNKKALSELSE